MCPGLLTEGTDTHGLVIGCVKGPWECEESLLSNHITGSLGVGSRDPMMVLPFFWSLRCFQGSVGTPHHSRHHLHPAAEAW